MLMSKECIWKSLIDCVKLSKLNPIRVRGIHKNPKLILGREPDKNEDIFYYWVEVNGKVYSEYGVIDIDDWNEKYKDYNREVGNEYGLLPNELTQFNDQFKRIIEMIYNENEFNKKNECIKILEQLWSQRQI